LNRPLLLIAAASAPLYSLVFKMKEIGVREQLLLLDVVHDEQQ